MKSIVLLLVLGACLVSATGQGQDYKGRSFTEWKARMRSQSSFQERQEAIRAVAQIGWHRVSGSNNAPEDVRWMAQEITPSLMALLDDADIEVRLEAVRALIGPFGARANKTPTEVLHKLVKLMRELTGPRRGGRSAGGYGAGSQGRRACSQTTSYGSRRRRYSWR